jgi:uncharacterized protein RhaS with RHS repeats
MTTPSLLAQDEGVRYYDPATGQFLSRDPLVSLTRSAYGYVYGNPLNATDPSGLWPDIDWGAVGQGVADFSGGVLNGITLGHADVFIDEDKVRWDSNWTRGGNVVGVALDIPLLVPQAAGAVGIEATAAGGGLLFGSKMASGFYGASLTAYGFYDLKQANDVCQRSPGSPACERAMKEAWVQTSVGGLAGFFPGAGGLAALLFGIYDCTNDYSDR